MDAESEDFPDLNERFGDRPPVRDALAALKSYEAKLADLQAHDDEETRSIAQARIAVSTRCLTAFETVDPLLLDDGLANALKNHAENASNAIDQQGTGSPEASSHHEKLRSALRQLASIPTGGAEAQPLAYLTDDARKLLGTLSERISQLEERRDAAAEALKEAKGQLKELLDQGTGRVDELRAQLKTDVEEALHNARQAIEEDREAFARRAEELNNEGEQLLTQLRQRLSRSADDALSAGYGNAAKKEERVANVLRIGAVLAVLAVGVIAVSALVAGTEDELAWSDAGRLLGRVAAVGAFAALARYLAVEAGSHRTDARRLRQVELELANLDEYLSALEPAQREAVRRELVDRYFHPDLDKDRGTAEGIRLPQDEVLRLLRGLESGSKRE